MADVVLPQLGETVTEGTITQWFKKVGDTVAADEPLFEVSTDKVDTEVPSPVAGVVTEIRAAEGDTVDVGTVIAVVAADGAASVAAAPAVAAPQAASAPQAAPAPPAAPPTPPAPVAAAPAAAPPTPQTPPTPPTPVAPPAHDADESVGAGGGDARLLSPVVRRLIGEHHLDPAQITGSGLGGRITRDDVLDFIDRRTTGRSPAAEVDLAAPAATPAEPAARVAPAPVPPAPSPATNPVAPISTADQRDRLVPLSKIRRVTGQHMVASKATSAHALSLVEVDYANVDLARLAVKDHWKQAEGFSLTYLPFICRAVIDGLARFPHLNSSLTDTDLVIHGYVDLAIAVDLDYEGLLAPVIRSAADKRLGAVAREIHDLASRARNRKLSPDEIQGGTFTITNNGSAGSLLTVPIINQPQVAIVSTDAIVRRPVVVIDPDGGEAIAIHPVGNLAMSWDHRAFDGAYAAGFLKLVKEILETRDWSIEL